ncbi:MAG: hypothetical protein LBI34_02335 [Puniceicoccales bacterium]|jgi:hypothetical protein|nr:hypothetical protein [Puniceicoccales bacterium]
MSSQLAIRAVDPALLKAINGTFDGIESAYIRILEDHSSSISVVQHAQTELRRVVTLKANALSFALAQQFGLTSAAALFAAMQAYLSLDGSEAASQKLELWNNLTLALTTVGTEVAGLSEAAIMEAQAKAKQEEKRVKLIEAQTDRERASAAEARQKAKGFFRRLFTSEEA